ncbi:hypothetical protein G6F40_015281 [Rhizopus arrhizus]|nr:hypothetical protein G6F40_015281 [Rhizopus arrhizus]
MPGITGWEGPCRITGAAIAIEQCAHVAVEHHRGRLGIGSHRSEQGVDRRRLRSRWVAVGHCRWRHVRRLIGAGRYRGRCRIRCGCRPRAAEQRQGRNQQQDTAHACLLPEATVRAPVYRVRGGQREEGSWSSASSAGSTCAAMAASAWPSVPA